FIHGGLGQRQIRELNENTRTNPTLTRFLDRGYVIAAATFRTYGNTPTSRGPILDALAVIAEVRELPQVDPESIVIYGGSGGGSIALELAGEKEASPVAVVAGEPATVLYTGLMTELAMREPAMRDFKTLYGEAERKATEAKIANISCPILIHHGDVHLLKRINFELVFPAIERAGKSLTVLTYPREQHGFYWGYHTNEMTLNKVVENSFEFIEPLLKSAPAHSPHSATRTGASRAILD
ncbi:MAG: prolyl oligopeptidase family serine peptidase, partial [Verrucomicrobiota bacterium]